MTVTALPSLRVTKTIRANPERLFRAWIDPKQLAQWWHLQGDGWSFSEAVVDLRDGGSYRLAMTGPDGKAYVAVGEYLEIRRPTRLVFSWHWLKDSRRGPKTRVTVEFNRTTGDETEVVLTHTQLADETTSAGHLSGWTQLLTVLKHYVGSNNHDD
jgi:uncharacterized protein YndB with AHSA1/START domain